MNKKILYVAGTHCASCEVLVERRFKKIPGVERVRVNFSTGKARVEYSCEAVPALEEFDAAVSGDGYHVFEWKDRMHERATVHQEKNTSQDYKQMGIVAVVLTAAYLMLTRFHLIPDGIGVKDNMSYGFVFLIGLVAAASTCIAVTGGLLVAVAARYNQTHNFGAESSAVRKLKPHLLFNVGRLASYGVFGGIIGGLGSTISLSSRANGIITLIASLVMVSLGLRLLKLFPKLSKFQIPMPKVIAHRIHDLQTSDHKWAPLVFGASSFFLPCGFTQALQLYVLSRGDAVVGALTMLVFALGTMPALLSLGVISSVAKGMFQSYFLKFAGVVVIVLGAWNMQAGLALVRISGNVASEDVVQMSVNAKAAQVVSMKVDGYEYEPSQFTVRAGVPVEWRIDGSKAGGCARVITMPGMDITKSLASEGETVISFTPTRAGKLPFSCTMGMTTPGAGFIVVN